MPLRLHIVLPAVQVLLAAALIQWEYSAPGLRGSEYFSPPARLLRLGLDAPARPFLLLYPETLFRSFMSDPPEGPIFVWLPRSVAGFHLDDAFFLLGTALTWYFVGRGIDRRISGVGGGGSNLKLLLAYVFLLALGAYLFEIGVHDLGPNRPESTIPPVGAAFTLVWAIVLIFIPVWGMIRFVQARRTVRAS